MASGTRIDRKRGHPGSQGPDLKLAPGRRISDERFYERRLESRQALEDFVQADDQRGRDAHDIGSGHQHDKTFVAGGLHYRSRLALPRSLELAAEPDAFAANVGENFAPRIDGAQAFHEQRVPSLDAVENLGGVDDVEDGAGPRARERIAAVGRAVHADRKRAGDFGGRQHRAQREAAAQALGAGQDVRDDTFLHVGKQRTGTAHAALNLVEDQQGVVLVAEPARRGQEFRRAGDHAAFTLHRLEDYGADVIAAFFGKRRFQPGDIV